MPDPDDPAAALARQAAELHVLQRVAAEINSTLDLEEIYDLALRTFGDLFESHHALILLVEPGGLAALGRRARRHLVRRGPRPAIRSAWEPPAASAGDAAAPATPTP